MSSAKRKVTSRKAPSLDFNYAYGTDCGCKEGAFGSLECPSNCFNPDNGEITDENLNDAQDYIREHASLETLSLSEGNTYSYDPSAKTLTAMVGGKETSIRLESGKEVEITSDKIIINGQVYKGASEIAIAGWLAGLLI